MERVTAKEKADTKESRRAKATKATSRRRMSTVSRSSDGEIPAGDKEMKAMNTASIKKENGGKLVC